MSAESIVKAMLTQHAALAALVADRVYPLLLPEGKPLPAVVFDIVGRSERKTLSMAATSRHVRVQVRITSVAAAAEFPRMVEVDAAVRKACESKINVTLAGIPNVVVLSGAQMPDAADTESARQLCMRARDYWVTYMEPQGS
jgi:hypothetical protein